MSALRNRIRSLQTTVTGGLVAALMAGIAPPGHAAADNPFEDLYVAQDPPAAGSLTVTYFGTTTVLFRLGSESLLTDGFFSRPGGLVRLALGQIEPDRARIARAMTRGDVPKHVNAVLVSHTHHDHALDSARVACDTDAVLVGTQSLLSLQHAQLGSNETCGGKFQHVQARMKFGAFEVEAANSEHTPGLLMEGSIGAIAMPAHFTEFKMDGNLSFLIDAGGHKVLMSAGMPVNRGRFKGTQAKVVFLSIGGLRANQGKRIEEYWDATVKASGATVVIPTHWDDFTEELDNPLPVMPRLLGHFRTTMCKLLALAERDHVAVRLLPVFARVDVEHLARMEGQPSAATAHPACKGLH